MAWDKHDFLVFGVMVTGVVVIGWLVRRYNRNRRYRIAFGLALAAAFILVWANGAVGIIGAESNDANLMFFAVLATGAFGALIARFRPVGMARAMFATAVAHTVVAVIAIIGELGAEGAAWPLDVLVSTTFFVTLWLLSAWFFKRSERRRYPGELELKW